MSKNKQIQKDQPFGNNQVFTTPLPDSEVKNITDESLVSIKEVKECIKNALEPVKELNPKCNIKRNQCGLIEGLNYEFDSLGFVNYKNLIPREFLVPNKQYFKSKNLPVPESADDLPDNQKIVLLNGYRLLGAIRGIKSVNHKIVSSSFENVIVETTIEFIGNYETNYTPVTYTALATASLNNTQSFAKDYLAEIAQNRGECRAIRGFLRIPILAADELGKDSYKEDESPDEKDNSLSPHKVLQKKLDEKNTTFDRFKDFCIKREFKGASEWTNLESIPRPSVAALLELMNNKK